MAMQPGKRRQLDLTRKWAQLLEQAKQLKASIRAKVEHPFRVVKRQFGYVKVRYRGLKKNTAQLVTLFRAVEPVDGAPRVEGTGWTSPSETGKCGLKKPRMQPPRLRMT